MAIHLYEMLYIIDSTLDENTIQRLANEVKDVIKENQGEITKESNWGSRKLAFEIKKRTDGVFINLEFKAPEKTPSLIAQFVKTHNGVLRHLVIQIPKAKLLQEKLDADKRQRELEQAEKEREELRARQAAAEAASAEAAAQAARESETVEEKETEKVSETSTVSPQEAQETNPGQPVESTSETASTSPPSNASESESAPATEENKA